VRYWVVHGSSYAAVASFVKSHPPSGLSWEGGGYNGGPGIPQNGFMSVTIIRPAIIGAANAHTVSVSYVQLGDGDVGIAASAVAAWASPRPAGETVPSGARVLDIRLYPDSRPAHTLLSLTVTTARRLKLIASAIDGLPTVQVVGSCPAAITLPHQHLQSTSVSFTFRGAPDSRALAAATVTASATAFPTWCNPMTMTVLGRSQPALLGGAAVIRDASKLLRVRLSRRQP
jgi:hypothetical protein